MRFPLYVAPKIHGVPCHIVGGKPTLMVGSHMLNKIVEATLSGLPPMLGYLVVGKPDEPDTYERSQAVREAEGAPDFTFYVHDCSTASRLTFEERRPLISSYANSCGAWVQPVIWTRIEQQSTFDEFEKSMKPLGYHGVLTRYPDER